MSRFGYPALHDGALSAERLTAHAAAHYHSHLIDDPGFSVALIGPDGAGKTTVARRVERALPMRATYIYMGVNPDASSHLLPTTRFARSIRRRRVAGRTAQASVPADEGRSKPGVYRSMRSGLHVANWIAEEWYRQLLAWWHLRKGAVVIFDRHFYADYHADDIAAGERPIRKRIHGFFLSRLYPRPDLVVYLDASAEVLLARKGEGTIESLTARRREYQSLAATTEHYVSVDAERPITEVVDSVVTVIGEFAKTRSVSRVAS